MHALPRLLATLCLLLPFAPAMAATPLACGTYQSEDGSARLVIESGSQATLINQGQAPTRYLIRQDGDRLHVADLTNGFGEHYVLRDNGRRINSDFEQYTLTAAQACATAPKPAAGSCRADIDHCMHATSIAPVAQLAQWCQEDLPFACNELLSRYQSQAQNPTAAADAPDLTEPPVCQQGNPQFDEGACREAAGQVLALAIAKAFAGTTSGGLPPALPQARLDELLQLCGKHPDAGFCEKVAEVHWNAGHVVSARTALQAACTAGADQRICGQVLPLDGNALLVQNATRLPCGDYKAATGLMDTLSFSDQGRVSLGMGNVLSARLQDGAIHIRHDKGGDFILRQLVNGQLLGMDQWNRYALYQRTGGASRCSAPVAYEETPLPQDCPPGSDPQVCCDSGRLQGCNTLGHRHALAGNWQAALPYYMKLCTAGVRAGCENVRSVYEHTGEEDIPGKLLSLCRRDGNGTHVACDLYGTTNWAMLGMGPQLQRAFEQAAEEATPDTGSGKPDSGKSANNRSLRK